MKNHNKRISIIIVEYNSIKDIETCYNSIKSIAIANDIEVIASSNSCYSPEKQANISSKHAYISWQFNEYNGGFAYAMNQGLKIATGDILIIMNPDVIIKKGIENMINFLIQNETIGIIAPMIKNKNGVIQDSFREFINPFNFINRHLNRLCNSNNQQVHTHTLKVDWIIGAFMMMPRSVYNIVKGFDDAYFLYCEDMDLCKRVHNEGFDVVYYPEAIVEYEGTRSARKSLKYSRIFIKSLLRYWSKFGFK